MYKKQHYALLKDAVTRENDTNKRTAYFNDFTFIIKDTDEICVEVYYKGCYLSEMILFDNTDYKGMELVIFDRFIWGIYDTVGKFAK